jgi:4-hydroxy 2-oxovalerate aldolase
MKKNYGWGTNLPYIFSGAYSLPQKEVMEWIGMNRYPIASILNALNNKKNSLEDNLNLPNLEIDEMSEKVLIVGGGNSVKENAKALRVFLKQNKSIKIIHTGLNYISTFSKVTNDQFYALVGFEGVKLLESLQDLDISNKKFVYPPHPRKMGTLIPKETLSSSFELSNINFTKFSADSPLAIAIQLALNLNAYNIYFIGFDGYDTKINKNQFKLVQENQNVFFDLLKVENVQVETLTPSKYENLINTSIYSLLK